jgi:hypothetical protein
MRSMATERRGALRRLVGLGLAALGAPAVVRAASLGDPVTGSPASQASADAVFLAARRRAGRYEVAVLDAAGRDRQIVALQDRGHSFALDAVRGRAVAFGRQPGDFAMAFAIDGSTPPEVWAAPDGRHYFGHGVYADGGRLLLATENDYDAGCGVLGIYDASPGGAYRRLGEFATEGIGPHEVVLLPDRRTLCVANGGILTHPDYGKRELNRDSMRPSLVYVDVASGDVVDRVVLAPSLHQLSIRHLAVDAVGHVWFGCQYSGPAADQPPLVGRHRRGSEAQLFAGPPEVLRSLRNYVGSVAVDTAGGMVATSSPVGGVVAYWDAASGRSLGTSAHHDGCGVAGMAPGRFLVSDGGGGLVQAGPDSASSAVRAPSPERAWDNHMRRILLPAISG